MCIRDSSNPNQVEIDLPSQQVIRECGTKYPFEIDPFRKNNLLNGLDDIGLTMQKMEAIKAFETERSERYPWLDGATTRVPRLSAVQGLPTNTPSHQLATPSPEEWRKEVKARRAKRQALRQLQGSGGQAQRQQASGMHTKA